MRPPKPGWDRWTDRLFSIITPPVVWAALAVVFAARFWRWVRSRPFRAALVGAAAMRSLERWTYRLRNFVVGVAATVVVLCILAVGLVITAIARAVRWARSREADDCLFGVMLIVLAVVLLALLLSVVIAGPVLAE